MTRDLADRPGTIPITTAPIGRVPRRARRRGAALGALAVAAAAAATPLAGAPAATTSGHPAGPTSSPITLATGQQMETLGHPYDVATSSAGTAYIGWISGTTSSTDRMVHLCRLPVGATSCYGGVQTISSLGISSASGLRVLVDGSDTVHLVWFHDTDQSTNGPFNAAIAEATAVHGLNLTAASDVFTNAPSFGRLLDAELGPGGLWAVTYSGVPSQQLRVIHGAPTPAATVDQVATPYGVGYAELAFTGAERVLTIEKYGAITTAPASSSSTDTTSWTSFRPVANTWAVGTNAALSTTRHGLRLVTGVNNASYRPVIAAWNGSGFSSRQLTSDTSSCAPSSHDGWADASGRLLDVSWECSRVTVTNYPDAWHAAVVRFGGGGTPAHPPVAASGTRGIATVVWSLSTAGGETLRVAHVRLPDATRWVTRTSSAGVVRVKGPRSCLPPVEVGIGWSHKARNGWRLKAGTLRLDGSSVANPLDGARLPAGTRHILSARAVFVRNGHRQVLTPAVSFTTCAAR